MTTVTGTVPAGVLTMTVQMPAIGAGASIVRDREGAHVPYDPALLAVLTGELALSAR